MSAKVVVVVVVVLVVDVLVVLVTHYKFVQIRPYWYYKVQIAHFKISL